ncbi:MAG: elongation factor 3, partial [Rubritepida sp.]|nr:elongation factor 3 [Rubritepida sp.]
GEGIAARSAARAPRESTTLRGTASAPVSSKRMSFKDQHALTTLPVTMEKLHKEIGVLQNWLADPGLYARDPKGFQQRTAALAERQAALEAAEGEWLRLEMLREEIDG